MRLVETCDDCGKMVLEPDSYFDLDRDGKKDVMVFKENGADMVYVSLRFLLASTVTGVGAAVAMMQYVI